MKAAIGCMPPTKNRAAPSGRANRRGTRRPGNGTARYCSSGSLPAAPNRRGKRANRESSNVSFTICALACAHVAHAHSGSADAAVLTLEAYAERAGAALACAYSSSAEFDAALIAERRAAGVYGPKRHRKQKLAVAAGIAAGLAVIIFLIV